MSYIKWPVIVIIALFPALSIVVHNAGNACLYLLLICSIVSLAFRYKPMETGFGQLLKQYWPLHLAMAALFLAVIFNQISTGVFDVKQYDRVFRLAVFAPVFWVILCVPLRYLKHIQWAFIAGVILAFIKVYLITDGGQLPNSGSVGFMAGIAFSNATLLLGVWALLSIGWGEREHKFVIALKTLSCFAALYVTLMVKTRGTWLAIPFFAVFIFMSFGNIQLRRKLAILFFFACVFAGLFATNSAIQARIYDAKKEITLYAEGVGVSRDTSVGQRLELWKGSWYLFKEHPVFGIGRANFKSELGQLAERGIITPSVVVMPHSHNGIFFNMALWGIFGLLGILSVYSVPFYYFFREIRHPDHLVRSAAVMGATLCLGFFIYDMTDVMFFWTVLNGFYSMSVATFLACIIKRKKELERIKP